MNNEFSEELAFVKNIIKKAGNILLTMYECPSGIEKKQDGTLVSDADKASSEYIVSELEKSYIMKSLEK